MIKHLEQGNNDFYTENGLVVFTKEYHLKRGYCCKNGCKHCPYKQGLKNVAFKTPELPTVPPYDAEGFISYKKKED